MTYLAMAPAVMGAACAAYCGNRLLYSMIGRQAAVAAVPWWEEACKFAATYVAGGVPMLYVHVLFGALEFGYDLWRSRSNGLFLGVMSFAGHGLFGGLAMLVYNGSGNMLWAYLMAGLAHTVYNLGVLSMVLPSLGASPTGDLEKR
jgi:hypothetical protein